MIISFNILLSILIPQVLNIQSNPLPISLPENNVVLRYAEADLGSDSVNLSDFNLQGRFGNTLTSYPITQNSNKGLVMTYTTGQAAGIFLKEQLAADTVSPGFSTYYVMNVYRVGSRPADGYVFVIAANSNSLGSSGGGLGYSGILNSVGIEFDFHDNGGENMASSDVFANGSISSSPGTVFDSDYLTRWGDVSDRALVRSFHTWIEYNHRETKLELRVVPSNNENPNSNRPTRPTSPLLTRTINLSQLSNYFYGGFTAATGGLAQEMSLKSWYFSNAYIPGGINPDSQAIVVDSVAPTSPTLSTTLINDEYQLEVSGGEDNDQGSGIAGYQYKVNQGNWSTYASSIPMTSVGEYFARSVDRAGNYSLPAAIHLYQIRFWVGDAMVETINRLSTDDPYVITEQFEKENYLYQQWFANPSLTGEPIVSVAGRTISIDLYGYPTPKTYAIAYSLSGGQLTNQAPTTFTVGQELSLITPTKVGYEFSGWYLDGNLSTAFNQNNLPIQNITLHAKWTLIDYTITYQYHGGDVANNPQTYTVESTTIDLIQPVRAGFIFAGWYNNESYQGNAITQIQSGSINDVTLHAKWVGITTTIYFVTHQTINPITIQSGESIGVLPTLTMTEGFIFQGWSLTLNDANSIITSDYVVGNSLTLQLFPIWSTTSPTSPINLLTRESIANSLPMFEIIVFMSTLLIGAIFTTLAIIKRNHHGSL
jgi:uncharacterized repeat protein (TIGR02543 family)